MLFFDAFPFIRNASPPPRPNLTATTGPTCAVSFSATAETLHASGAAVAHAHPAVHDDHRHLPPVTAVGEHLLQPVAVGLDIVVHVTGERRPGAVRVGSALFSVDDDLLHAASPCWLMDG